MSARVVRRHAQHCLQRATAVALVMAVWANFAIAQSPALSAPQRTPDVAALPPSDFDRAAALPPPPLSSSDPKHAEELEVEAEQVPGFAPLWYVPWTWIPWDGWTNSAELGINGGEGNAQSLSLQTGLRFKRKTDFTLLDLRLTHNRTYADGLETQNNALMFADFERFLGQTPWTLFVKNGLEYDEFRAFDLRYNINSGAGYRFFNTPDLSVTGRVGGGASREFGGPDEDWVPEALFGADYEHQWTDRQKAILRIDYFPDWTDFNNFRLVSDAAWEYLLDESGNLSLKLGAQDRYDSTPNGLKANDLTYSALLLYKF